MQKKLTLFLFLFVISLLQAKEAHFLTHKERLWIQQHKSIRVGITQIPNQILLKKDQKPTGLCIDLFRLLAQKTGIKFHYVIFESWNELLQAAKDNRVDIIFLAQKTASRLQYFHYTDTILTLQNKLIVNSKHKFQSLEELNNHKLAITQGSAIEEYLRDRYPHIIIVPTQNELQSLEYVANKRADATVIEVVRASAYIREHNINNLIISSNINYNYYLSIASTKQLPQLNIILSKAIKELPKTEIAALKLKWGYIRENNFFFDKQTIIYLTIAFAIIIPFTLYLFLINKRLHKEMREKELALKRVTQLRDSKLNDMSEIINMIAHQWKQPLNNLTLLIQLVITNYNKNKLNQKNMEYFQVNSKKQISLMSNTISDFIDLFKSNEKKEPFDLKEMIENLINLMNPIMKRHNITIHSSCSIESHLITNYKNMLFQIIMNIMSNAKDALLQNDIKEKIITIKLKNQDNKTIIEIQDNGGGIDETIIDKIFDPYFSTKEDKHGTGMGLYMAKIILQERMQGNITVQNKNNGALFSIILQ